MVSFAFGVVGKFAEAVLPATTRVPCRVQAMSSGISLLLPLKKVLASRVDRSLLNLLTKPSSYPLNELLYTPDVAGKSLDQVTPTT